MRPAPITNACLVAIAVGAMISIRGVDNGIQLLWMSIQRCLLFLRPRKRARIIIAEDAVMLPLQHHQGGTFIRFPLVSFGLQVYDSDEIAYNLTQMALEVGYRNFVVDTQHQQAFAQAIVDSSHVVTRQEVFITSAVPSLSNNNNMILGKNDNDDKAAALFNLLSAFASDNDDEEAKNAYEWTRRACQQNLAAFAAGNVHTLDQLLLDVPPGLSCNWIRGQWRALEEIVQAQQKVRTLAVSNFSPRQMDCLLDDPTLTVKPVVNQLPFSVAYHPANAIRDNRKRGVLLQAWSPLGGSAHRFSESIIAACADVGKHYDKSFAQVALRWIIQKGAALTVRSTVREHFVEDLSIFAFELSSNDMAFLDSLASS